MIILGVSWPDDREEQALLTTRFRISGITGGTMLQVWALSIQNHVLVSSEFSAVCVSRCELLSAMSATCCPPFEEP